MTTNAGEYEIKFLKKGLMKKNEICGYFGWKNVHLTINGHCIVNVKNVHLKVFEEAAERQFFQLSKGRKMAKYLFVKLDNLI